MFVLINSYPSVSVPGLLYKKAVGYDVIDIIIEYDRIRQIILSRFPGCERGLFEVPGPISGRVKVITAYTKKYDQQRHPF
ncbi:hypothetical protein D3C87_2033530 [compost metagenome]